MHTVTPGIEPPAPSFRVWRQSPPPQSESVLQKRLHMLAAVPLLATLMQIAPGVQLERPEQVAPTADDPAVTHTRLVPLR